MALSSTTVRLAAPAMVIACVLFAGITASVDAKKKEESKKKAMPILDKSAELKKDDDKDPKTKAPRKIFPITLTAGKKYQIDLMSKDFDAYVRLVDGQDNEVAFNDDADASTWDARIVYQPAKTGDFKIVASTYNGKVGKFSVVVIEADKKTPLMQGSRFTGKAIELKLKEGKIVYKGELDERDPTVFKRAYKLYAVTLEEGKSYRIESRAADPKTLDAYLFLEDANGSPLASDSIAGDASNPRIVFKAVKTGVYRIIATSARGGQTGRFTLEIGSADEAKKGKK